MIQQFIWMAAGMLAAAIELRERPYQLPIKVTVLPPDEVKEFNEWSNLVKPLVGRCKVAVALEQNAVFNNLGAEALGKLLETMGRNLDYAVQQKFVDVPKKELDAVVKRVRALDNQT